MWRPASASGKRARLKRAIRLRKRLFSSPRLGVDRLMGLSFRERRALYWSLRRDAPDCTAARRRMHAQETFPFPPVRKSALRECTSLQTLADGDPARDGHEDMLTKTAPQRPSGHGDGRTPSDPWNKGTICQTTALKLKKVWEIRMRRTNAVVNKFGAPHDHAAAASLESAATATRWVRIRTKIDEWLSDPATLLGHTGNPPARTYQPAANIGDSFVTSSVAS